MTPAIGVTAVTVSADGDMVLLGQHDTGHSISVQLIDSHAAVGVVVAGQQLSCPEDHTDCRPGSGIRLEPAEARALRDALDAAINRIEA